MLRLFPEGHPWRLKLVRMAEVLRPHKALLAVAAGLSLQWAAVNSLVTRPLTTEVQRLTIEVAASAQRMNQLAALRGDARQTQDLLSALNAQRQSLDSAEQALADIRQLRMNLEQEARRTAAAAGALTRLGELQQRLVQTGDQTARLTAVLEQLAQLNSRIEALSQPAATSLAAAAQADGALAQLAQMQARLVEQAATLPAALATVEQSLQMQSTLADAAQTAALAQANAGRMLELVDGLNTAQPTAVAAASEHAADLLALHDLLADARTLRLSEAEDNLQALLRTQADLLRATPHIGAAAENLELLTDFQAELTKQLGSLTQVRKELLEVALLRETVSAVASAVQPLAEMSDLRRLDATQVRAVARDILARRMALSSDAGLIGEASPFPALPVTELKAAVPTPHDP